MVICACSPGEYALGSENLGAGRSAFGYFFEQGLTAPEVDTNSNNLIEAQEFQQYLVRSVDDWAMRYRGVHQVPYVAGTTKRDFALRAIHAPSASGGFASLWPWGKSRTAATAEFGGGASRRCAGGRGENQANPPSSRPARIRPKDRLIRERHQVVDEGCDQEDRGGDQQGVGQRIGRRRSFPVTTSGISGLAGCRLGYLPGVVEPRRLRAALRVFRRLGAMLLRGKTMARRRRPT